MQPLVRVNGLTKKYRDIIALCDVALTVREGEVLGRIGPNGRGEDGRASGRTLFLSIHQITDAARVCDPLQCEGERRLARGPLQRHGEQRRPLGVPQRHQARREAQRSGRNNAPPHPDLFPANNPVLRPPVAGRIGLWAKTDSTSCFKDYVVRPEVAEKEQT